MVNQGYQNALLQDINNFILFGKSGPLGQVKYNGLRLEKQYKVTSEPIQHNNPVVLSFVVLVYQSGNSLKKSKFFA